MEYYVGFGSNLGDRRSNLENGLALLARRGAPASLFSSVFETEPVEAPGSPWFLNLVARLATDLEPLPLLDLLQDIERQLGRSRAARNAPRTLDLDLLLAEGIRCEGPRLVLPHPRIWERRFVLEPLVEIAPWVRDEATGRSALEICRSLPPVPRVVKLGALGTIPRAPGV